MSSAEATPRDTLKLLLLVFFMFIVLLFYSLIHSPGNAPPFLRGPVASRPQGCIRTNRRLALGFQSQQKTVNSSLSFKSRRVAQREAPAFGSDLQLEPDLGTPKMARLWFYRTEDLLE